MPALPAVDSYLYHLRHLYLKRNRRASFPLTSKEYYAYTHIKVKKNY